MQGSAPWLEPEQETGSLRQVRIRFPNRDAKSEEKANAFLKNEEFNNKYQELINQGLTDEAERLKLINELEQKGIRLKKEKVDAILAERKNLQKAKEAEEEKKKAEEGRKNLNEQLKGKAESLKDTAMRNAGYGREAAQEKALRNAEKTKGSALTEKEKARVIGNADLEWDMEHREAPQLGDLAIKTNSLTSRGGFATARSCRTRMRSTGASSKKPGK